MATALEAVVEELAGDALVVVDPNCRPSAISDPDGYRRRLRPVLGRSQIVKVSEEDLAWLDPKRTPAAGPPAPPHPRPRGRPLARREAHPRAVGVVRIDARHHADLAVREAQLAADRVRVDDPAEDLDDLGVERGARAVEDDLDAAVGGTGGVVGPLARERVV